jgi:hypothetical protein
VLGEEVETEINITARGDQSRRQMVDSDSDELSCSQDNDSHFAETFKSSEACEMFKSVKMGKKLG